MTMVEHILPERLLHQPVKFLVVGAGGNGSQFVNGLARLHVALRAIGHRDGLDVLVCDPDRVTDANVGRQLFSPSDVGQYKASVLVHRLNSFYNLDWKAQPKAFKANDRPAWTPHFIVGCVDTAAARRSIHQYFDGNFGRLTEYWLDLGNQARCGQVVLGQNKNGRGNQITPLGECLPFVTELFPELLDNLMPEDDSPSCSLAEALGKQDLFINQAVTTWALHLLWNFFRHGRLNCHGYFVNLETGSSRPMPIDPAAWQRMRDNQPVSESVTTQRNKKRAKARTTTK